MASTNNYINEYATLDEMNAAYESDHSGSWVAYCAEDNNLYYQQKTSISSKYFDNLEYNSENKTLDFYIDGEVKKSIDVSPWWFEKDSYYTREESDSKYINNIGTSGNNLTYTIDTTTTSLTIPYASSTPWKGVTNTPTTLNGYGITNQVTGIRSIMVGDNDPQYVWLLRIQINGSYVEDCLDLAVRRRYAACDIKVEIKHWPGPDSSYPILSGGTQVRYYLTDWYGTYGLKNYASAVYYVTKISEDGTHDVVDFYTYKDCNWDIVGYNIANWVAVNTKAEFPEEGKTVFMLIDKMETVSELPSGAVLMS